MPFKIVRNDITKMHVDAIVNTANEQPRYSCGTDTAVYKAAGEELLLNERKKIGFMEEGEVAITPGFNLPARYIIHAVSPCYIDGTFDEEEKLRSCYRRSLELAKEYHCESIAFPLISTGSFGYPKEEGMRIAVDEIHAFLMNNAMLIYLVVFDTAATRLGLNLYPDLEAYIDHNYVCEKREEEYGDRFFGSVKMDALEYAAHMKDVDALESKLRKNQKKFFDECAALCEDSIMEEYVELQAPVQTSAIWEEDDFSEFLETNAPDLQERMKHMSDTFQEYLMYLIETKNLSNSEVYKRAIVTKQLFSKIKLNPNYHPDKATAMRLCIGAKLNLDETKDLLARAGYALSPCDKRDIIFSFFIEHEVFDMIEIDIALEEHGLPCFIE